MEKLVTKITFHRPTAVNAVPPALEAGKLESSILSFLKIKPGLRKFLLLPGGVHPLIGGWEVVKSKNFQTTVGSNWSASV